MIDVLLALLAALAIAVPVVSRRGARPGETDRDRGRSQAPWAGSACCSVALSAARQPAARFGLGAWLALAGALIAWIGRWLSMRDESTPGAVPPELPRRPAPPRTAA